jgi:hypothetical protein
VVNIAQSLKINEIRCRRIISAPVSALVQSKTRHRVGRVHGHVEAPSVVRISLVCPISDITVPVTLISYDETGPSTSSDSPSRPHLRVRNRVLVGAECLMNLRGAGAYARHHGTIRALDRSLEMRKLRTRRRRKSGSTRRLGRYRHQTYAGRI